MADRSKIEWTDATWNPITGCSVVSPGCRNCYAMRLAGGRMKDHPSRAGLTEPGPRGPVWTGAVRFNAAWLDQPLRWRRPRNIFVVAHGDLFHEAVPDEWIDRVFAVMALAPQHRFQVLTKRPARMLEYMTSIEDARPQMRRPGDSTLPAGNGRLRDETGHEGGWRSALVEGMAQKMWAERNPKGGDPSPWLAVHLPLNNVWLGTSAEDQARVDERIPRLLETPAAVRWVSAEPLLGPIQLYHLEQLDWVVAGGESGPGARPMAVQWARALRDQCVAAGVPYFFKQWGEWAPHSATDRDEPDPLEPVFKVGKRHAGRRLDGVLHDGTPA